MIFFLGYTFEKWNWEIMFLILVGIKKRRNLQTKI